MKTGFQKNIFITCINQFTINAIFHMKGFILTIPGDFQNFKWNLLDKSRWIFIIGRKTSYDAALNGIVIGAG